MRQTDFVTRARVPLVRTNGTVHPEAPRAADRPSPTAPLKRRRLVYVLAASHSGSTLLSMLLAAHPEICTVGELKATIHDDVDRYSCSCGVNIRRCRFWQEIAAGMARRGLEFDITDARTDICGVSSRCARRLLRPLHHGRVLEQARDAALWLSPTWRTQRAVIQHRNAALIDTVCETSGCRIIVDSSKVALRLKFLLLNPALDVQIIRLVRDGRGVGLTYYLDEKRLAMGPAAREWRRSNEEAEALLARVDRARWVGARYEDLCADPARTLARLFAFIGVDPARATLDFRAREHHIVGNWMRLQASSEIVLDERWKTLLTPADLRAFHAVAGRMNRRYGYK